jgi:hypothetical protein
MKKLAIGCGALLLLGMVATATEASPALRTRVEPHRKALEANIGLAFFGL